MTVPLNVIDASVGVKWFRNEPGSSEARALLADYRESRRLLAVDSLFFYEVLRAASREGRPDDVERIWADLKRLDLITVPLGDELVTAAAAIRSECGCSLYDAFSAGLARLLEAELFSADRRAHATLPNVSFLG